jgi:hypothetical protein
MILNGHRRVLQAIAQVRRQIRALLRARICGYARPVIGPKHCALSTQRSRRRPSWRRSHDPHLPTPGSLLAYPRPTPGLPPTHPWPTPSAHRWPTLGPTTARACTTSAIDVDPTSATMLRAGPKGNAHGGQPTSPWPGRSTLRACTLLTQCLEVAVVDVSLRQCPSDPPFQHLRFRPMVLVIWQPATRCITRLGGRP